MLEASGEKKPARPSPGAVREAEQGLGAGEGVSPAARSAHPDSPSAFARRGAAVVLSSTSLGQGQNCGSGCMEFAEPAGATGLDLAGGQ